MIDEGESSTGEEDVELGQYVQTHDELSANTPDTAKGPSQSRAPRPSLSLKIPSLPSSSRSYYAKPSSRQPWSSARKRQRSASRSLSKVVNLLRLFLMLL
jgi:hypothetical protein